MFAEGLLHAKPCSEQRGGLWETAVLQQSWADLPDEGIAENEPGGIINRAFEKKLSFPKHMSEDLSTVFKALGPDAMSPE